MSTRALAPRLVGRRQQLAELAEHLSLARAGSGRLIFVCGEAGVGKTRLLRELAGALGAAPFVGHCFDELPAAPYGPFVELLQAIAHAPGAQPLAEAAGPWAGDLRRLLPDLLPGERAGAPEEPQTERRRLFQAIYQAIRPRGDEERVLIVEDLHWADEASRDLLAFLARAIAGERILLIGTYRSDGIQRLHPLASLIARLVRDRRHHEISLAPLSRDELAEMLADIIGAPPAGELVAALYERSEGNPFFAEELLGPLLAGAGRGLADAMIPLSIRDSLLRRAAGLDETASEVMRAAAVVGRRFDFALLQRLTGQDERGLLRCLAALVDRQLIAEVPGESGDAYHFRHELIRAALYEEMLRRERRLRHQEVLRALEELHGHADEPPLNQLAYHAIQARALPQAARYSELAGDRAASVHAYRAALGHYEAALEAGEQGEDRPGWRADLLARLGQMAFLVGDLSRASGYWREALGLFQQLGTHRRAADAQRSLSRVAWEQGDRPAAFALAHAALATLEPGGACRELAMAYSSLSHLEMLLIPEDRARAAASIAWGEKALAMARQLDDRAAICHALNNIGVAMADSGQLDAGIASIDHSLSIALDADLPADAVRAYLNLGGKLRQAGRPDEGFALMREGWAYAARHGHLRGSGKLFTALVYGLLEAGQWAEVDARLAEVMRPGHPDILDDPQMPLHIQAVLLWLRGRPVEARAILERLLVLADGDPAELLHVGHHLIFVYRSAGEHERALALADRLVGRVRAMLGTAPGSFALGKLAFRLTAPVEIYLDVGRRAEALALIDAMAAAGAEGYEAALLDEARGLANLEQHPLEADAHFARAAAVWSQIGCLPDQARLARRRAEALLSAGRAAERAAAQRQIAAARAIAAGIGCTYELAKLDALDPPSPPRSATTPRSSDGLTPRELEVLALITGGYSNRAIAEALVISEKTAEVHVRNILGKLGLSSRTQAAAYAVERGLARTSYGNSLRPPSLPPDR